jgi:hypothetical protein
MFVACCLSVLGHIPSSDASLDKDDVVLARKVTYADWSENQPSPMTFYELTAKLHSMARQMGCLLLRKLKLRNSGEASERTQLALRWAHLVYGDDATGSRNTTIEVLVQESLTRSKNGGHFSSDEHRDQRSSSFDPRRDENPRYRKDEPSYEPSYHRDQDRRSEYLPPHGRDRNTSDYGYTDRGYQRDRNEHRGGNDYHNQYHSSKRGKYS